MAQRDRPPAGRVRRPPDSLPQEAVPISTGLVEVRRDLRAPRQVTVMVNGVPSSFHDLDDPRWLEFEYMQYMAAVIRQLPAGPLSAIHLGAGACTLARWLDAVRPGSVQLAVDIDAELVRLVREWFELPRSPALRVRVGEAREILQSRADHSADVVIRDVFAPDVTPPHLSTVEFAEQVARVLRPGGVYLANCADRPPLRIARAEAATFRAVFADVALITEPAQLKGRRHGNLVLAGMPTPGAGPRLGASALARDLRTLAVPAHLVHGRELAAFAAGAQVMNDPP